MELLHCVIAAEISKDAWDLCIYFLVYILSANSSLVCKQCGWLIVTVTFPQRSQSHLSA